MSTKDEWINTHPDDDIVFRGIKYWHTLHVKSLLLVKESRHKMLHVLLFHLFKKFKIGKFIETSSKLVTSMDWREG